MTNETQLGAKVDSIVKLLQDLIIFEACKAKGNKRALRQLLGIRNVRIAAVSKVLKDRRE